MTKQTIVLDADHGKVDSAAKKTAGEYRKVANEAAGVGRQVDKWGRQFAEKAAGLGAILGTIRAVGQEFDRQTAAAAGANRSRGGSAVSRQNNLRELGMDQGASGMGGAEAAILGGAGGTTVADRDAFLGGMVGMKQSSKTEIPRENFARAQALFNTGLFSQKELGEAIGDGSKLTALMGQAQSRGAGLTDTARGELAAVEFERNAGNSAEENRAGRGLRARIAQQQKDAFEAANPLAAGFRNVVNTATMGAVDALETETLSGKDGGALLREQSAILRSIEASNARMATPRPTMSPVTEGGP